MPQASFGAHKKASDPVGSLTSIPEERRADRLPRLAMRKPGRTGPIVHLNDYAIPFLAAGSCVKRPSLEERKELGTFLSSRRGRVQPGDLGLSTGQRRTPGLRREEVALLAGVSVSWYTWLEQGRDIGPSADVLARLSTVLRLDRTETLHLFALSSRQPPVVATGDELTDELVFFLQAIDPVPGYIRNGQLDILAWNPAAVDLFVDFGGLKPHERNTLRLMFLYPPYRRLMRDWEQQARGTIRLFRAARAKVSDRTPFNRLIEEIHAASEEFRAWWPVTDVRSFDEGGKRLRHPTHGMLDLTSVALNPEGRADLSLVTYIARPGDYDPES